MAWSSPITPVSGTVITVAWAVTSVVDPINWLRALTGGADPPAANRVVVSLSTSTSAWVQVPTDAIADGAVTDVKMGTQKVTRAGDTMTNDLILTRSGGTTGYLILGSNTAFYFGYDGSKHVLRTGRLDVLGDLYVYRDVAGAATTGYLILGTSASNFIGFDGTKLVTSGSFTVPSGTLTAPVLAITGNATVGGTLGVTGVISGPGSFPLNGVVWFPTLADLTAAGANWVRHTAADGRLLVGAGTAGSPTLSNPQTFAEATNYGTDWGHTHAGGSYATAGGFTGTAADAQTVQSGSGVSVSATSHQNALSALPVSGTSGSTVWLPGMRAGIWGRRNS